MFLFELLILSIIHLVVIGLDVVSFFLVIRALTLRWPLRPFLAMDRVGQPVTDLLIEFVARAIPRDWIDGDHRRKQVAAAVTLLVVALCRLALAGLMA